MKLPKVGYGRELSLTRLDIDDMRRCLEKGYGLRISARLCGISISQVERWRRAGDAILLGELDSEHVPVFHDRHDDEGDDEYAERRSRWEFQCALLAEFFLVTEEGRGVWQAKLLDRIYEIGDKSNNWFAFSWLMERMDPGEFGNRGRQLGGGVDKKVEVKHEHVHEISFSDTLERVGELYSNLEDRIGTALPAGESGGRVIELDSDGVEYVDIDSEDVG